MKLILFRPFDPVKWIVIAFSAWLARLTGGGGGGGSTTSFDAEDMVHQGDWQGSIRDSWEWVWDRLTWAPFVLWLVALGVLLIVLLVWLSSRGKLVFLDNVVRNEGRLVDPWRRTEHLGNSLFVWRLCFAAITLLVVGLLVVATAVAGAGAAASGPYRGPLLVLAIFLGLGIVIVGLTAAAVSTLLDNFVVPVMYRFNQRTTDAWRTLMPWLQNHAAAFFLYLLFVIALFILVGLGVVVVGLMTCCMGWLLVALPYIGTLVLLPLLVTYRLLGPEFLAQFDEGFQLLSEPPSPETQVAATE